MMSAKMTRIRIPGHKGGDYGYLDWGELTRPNMVATMRSRADYLRKVVEAIDGTPDAAFEIDVVRGSVVQHHIRSVP